MSQDRKGSHGRACNKQIARRECSTEVVWVFIINGE